MTSSLKFTAQAVMLARLECWSMWVVPVSMPSILSCSATLFRMEPRTYFTVLMHSAVHVDVKLPGHSSLVLNSVGELRSGRNLRVLLELFGSRYNSRMVRP